jgi:hypothetical protein
MKFKCDDCIYKVIGTSRNDTYCKKDKWYGDDGDYKNESYNTVWDDCGSFRYDNHIEQ